MRPADCVAGRRIVGYREPDAPQVQSVPAFVSRTSPTGVALRKRTSGRLDPSRHQDAGALRQCRLPIQRVPQGSIQERGCRLGIC